MATMIDKYNEAKREHENCGAWASLIGSEYIGGGGGKGHLHSLKLAQGEASPTVYHQYRDGAKNYHHMPAALALHLEAAIKARFGELVADALDRQAKELKVKAEAAVKEHAEMLDAAGLAA